MIGIPIDPVTIYPNMRVNAIPQVGVVGDLLFPPYILEPKSQLVQHTLVVAQQRQAESRIVIRTVSYTHLDVYKRQASPPPMFIVLHLFSSCFGFADIFFHLLTCRLDFPAQGQLFAFCADLPV